MPFQTIDKLEPEYRDLYDRWKSNPTPTNNAEFLKKINPWLKQTARSHTGSDDPLLMSQAKRLALESLGTYDPQQASLRTHLSRQLQGLRRIKRQQQQVLSIPERVALNSQQLEEVSMSLEHELGREPTLRELSDRTGLTPRRISYVRGFHQGVAEGTVAGPEGFTPATLGTPKETSAWIELVYADLDPTDQKILEWSLGLGGAPRLSNLEIARRLGRSPGAISQRKARIQQMLDQEPELSPFL